MANSPGPSSSTVNHPNSKNAPTDVSDHKKKRTRRKPRTKPKKAVNAVSEVITEGQSSSFIPKFVIQPVKEPLGVFYRHREKSLGPINFKTFLQNNTLPCIFQTQNFRCDPNSTLSVLEGLKKITAKLNGLCLPDSSKSSLSRKKSTTSNEKKKNKKKRANLLFPKYLSKREVQEGLKNGELVKGFVRINAKNFKEAYVGNIDTTKTDYVISSVVDRNRGLDGDEVVLRVKAATEEKKKLMEVVYITQMNHPRTAVGFLEPFERSKEFALFTPRDKRMPKMKIPKISWPSGFQASPQLYKDILFVARISDWKEVKYALGTITENLGLNGDLKVESLAILRDFCLDPTPYGPDIKRFLPKSPEIPKKEYAYRKDFRKECVFTIDPLTARDLDDAVSCKELENGNFEVGVHISDASFYLQEQTKLDEMVKKKATTIYMVDSVYHMLPVELCLHCSLLPGTDKLAFSVIWELTPSGHIVKKYFRRSIINSCVQLAYEHAQMMIDEPDRKFSTDELPEIHNGYTPEDLSQVVNNLQKIAVCLREQREQNGSLRIDQTKISFSLNPSTGEPNEFWIYENKPAHRLIEEFMLLANMSVAEFIYDTFPDLAFLRLHEPPKPTMMVDLQKNMETLGIHIDISSSGSIQSSLNKYIGHDSLGQSRMTVLNHLLAKPMQRARYFCPGALEDETPFTHFALSIPIYTHFTSPIRRYADIMVHRLLAAALKCCDKPKWQPEEVATISEICNRQKYNSKRASEASTDLYLAHYVEKNQPYLQDAVVVDTKEKSIDVVVLSTGSVVRLYTNNFGENVTVESEEIKVQRREDDENPKRMWKMMVTFPKTDSQAEIVIVLEIFTLIKVALTRKPKTNKLEATLLRPEQNISLL